MTPSWRYGPFAWLPLVKLDALAGAPVALGVLNLLPLTAVLGWGALRRHGTAWRWGRWVVTGPLLGLTVLGLLSLQMSTPRNVFLQVGGLGIAWLVYLFVINERPFLTVTFSLIVVVQSVVALAQFLWQRDVGLTWMGELPLNPAFSGVTVLFAREVRWLRAYGLTAHPNLLGAVLAVLLLFLWADYGRFRGWRQIALGIVLAFGFLGLFVSFSRSAWLGFGVGVGVWLFLSAKRTLHEKMEAEAGKESTQPAVFSWRSVAKYVLPVLPLLIMWLGYSDLALSRVVGLETAVEARSLDERMTDSRTALQLIAAHPWRGVGLGEYTTAAGDLDSPARRVHNVPLLISAELGLPGLLLWLTLAFAPLITPSCHHPLTPLSSSLWFAMLTMSQFDTMVWVGSNWQTAVLFALIAAHVKMSDGDCNQIASTPSKVEASYG